MGKQESSKRITRLGNTTAVLGAGITGLSTAYKLAEKGKHVVVLEREPLMGGLAGNVERKGAIFDYGPHTFFLDDAMKEEFYRIIDSKEVNVFRTNAKIKFGNKYYHYPLDAIDILIKSNPIVIFKCLSDYITAKVKMKTSHSVDDSAESWIINRFGETLYRIYFEKYTEKVWGLHPKFIAPSFTEERIPLLNLRQTVKATIIKAIKRLIRGEEREKFTYIVWGHYPKKGPGAFFERLANKIHSNDGIIHLNSKLNSIHLDGRKASKVSFEKDGDIKTIECDYVVSTIPINELVKQITPKADSPILKAANLLRFRAVVFVNLLVKKQDIFEARMLYFRNRTFNRVSETNKFSNELVPKGLTGLCAEITCDKDDETWNTDEQQLCDKVLRELEEEDFFVRKDVVYSFVTRKEHGYPVAALNYKENLNILRDYINNIENLFVTGRQGLFRYLQMDHCMKMGFEVAGQILSQSER